MKLLNALKARLSALKFAKGGDAGAQETAAMVYGGDIYAVLLHDRFARQLVLADSRRAGHRRDAAWPFIR